MKKYQVWSFCYVADERGINVLNGTREETDYEADVLCFDGIAFLCANGKYFIMTYPKIRTLTYEQKDEIEDYCGYVPSSGEYGVIAGALGVAREVSVDEFVRQGELCHKNIVNL